jgi:anti-anti-sigma factor
VTVTILRGLPGRDSVSADVATVVNGSPGPLLSVTTVPDPRPGRVVVEVVGEVDAYTAPLLDACLQSHASRPGVRELVVHLVHGTFLGGAGAEVLAQADRRCRMRGARLVIRTGGRRRGRRSSRRRPRVPVPGLPR